MCSRSTPLPFRSRSANPLYKGTKSNRVALNTAVPNKTCCKFLPRVTSVAPSSSPLLHVTRGEQRLRSCPAARSNDGTTAGEPEALREANGKQGGERVARRKGAVQEVFEGLYICGYVLCYRLGELVSYKVKEAIAKLRKRR
ncbi:hypothetical protein D1007_48289 [Hordeum vulgare]|uniref:Uncharacterized protein n=1 Tax=Hordeum vulgare subsp. vulgare TaxID=112509 RepID=A0A8I6WI47_HORVV|nr:hypothetical protein D1007_48289 [Hordeum vulgare]